MHCQNVKWTQSQGLSVRLNSSENSLKPLRTNTGSCENGDVDKTAQMETECIERKTCLFVVVCQTFYILILLFSKDAFS